jgi:hypothetical protein
MPSIIAKGVGEIISSKKCKKILILNGHNDRQVLYYASFYNGKMKGDYGYGRCGLYTCHFKRIK